MNYIQVSGRLTKNPKIFKHPGKESATVFLTVASEDSYTSTLENGEKGYANQFVPFQAYAKNANAIAYFESFGKGDFVEIEGRVKSYTDRKDPKNPKYETQLEAVKCTTPEPKEVRDARRQKHENPNQLTKAQSDANYAALGLDQQPAEQPITEKEKELVGVVANQTNEAEQIQSAPKMEQPTELSANQDNNPFLEEAPFGSVDAVDTTTVEELPKIKIANAFKSPY